MQKLSEYVMVAEAAKILGVSQNTVRAWSDERRLATHRNPANGYRLFKRKDLEAFLLEAEESVSSSGQPRPR